MDYSYFTAAPQPYHFIGLPPTPAHSQTPKADDYNNTDASVSISYVRISSYTYSILRQDTFDPTAFQAFESSFRFDPTALIQPHSPTKSLPKSLLAPNINSDGGGLDLESEQMARDSSEEKDNLTPAQSRRKAQNRAAYALSLPHYNQL